ncbi:MAG: hypothetical protein H0U13_12760 [Gemmatimonadaceae bacterium]|nr:hypothetical protein [Gemmatimonadaceae bacterium]
MVGVPPHPPSNRFEVSGSQCFIDCLPSGPFGLYATMLKCENTDLDAPGDPNKPCAKSMGIGQLGQALQAPAVAFSSYMVNDGACRRNFRRIA